MPHSTATTGATNGLSSQHPEYQRFRPDWQLVRDIFSGERAVKERGTLYLPATPGQILDGMSAGQLGFQCYTAYKQRASFPSYYQDAVENMLGMLWHKPPVIELPTQLEPLREGATIHNETLEQLLRRINEQQLVAGRLGLLLDLPADPRPDSLPYLATYLAEHVLNWDAGDRAMNQVDALNLVVLDESAFIRTDRFNWEFEERHRVLVLGDFMDNEAVGVYRAGVFEGRDQNFREEELIEPSLRGRTLDKIPFVFINSKDLLPQPDDPPLLGLAELVMTIYRGEADYRQSLFMQGQDTLVVLGERDPEREFRVGAGAAIVLPSDGDAKFIGVDSTGLSEQRQALENDKAQAMDRSARLITAATQERESGEALKIRIAAQSASLRQIALAGAGGLEMLLRTAAEWVGADPDQVMVQPNLEFADADLDADTLVKLQTAKSIGAPLSQRSIHEVLQERGFTKMSLEDELAEIEQETPLTAATENEMEDDDAGIAGNGDEDDDGNS